MRSEVCLASSLIGGMKLGNKCHSEVNIQVRVMSPRRGCSVGRVEMLQNTHILRLPANDIGAKLLVGGLELTEVKWVVDMVEH